MRSEFNSLNVLIVDWASSIVLRFIQDVDMFKSLKKQHVILCEPISLTLGQEKNKNKFRKIRKI
jgi:hypothetical protein